MTIIILLVGCSLSNNPNSKVEELLGKYQTLDSSINITPNLLSNSSNLDNDIEEEYKKAVETQYKNLSYELKDEKIDGDSATITTEIEVLDYKQILEKYQKDNYDEKEYHNNVIREFKNVKEKTTYTIDFSLTKDKNGKWSVDPLTTDMENKLLGIY